MQPFVDKENSMVPWSQLLFLYSLWCILNSPCSSRIQQSVDAKAKLHDCYGLEAGQAINYSIVVYLLKIAQSDEATSLLRILLCAHRAYFIGMYQSEQDFPECAGYSLSISINPDRYHCNSRQSCWHHHRWRNSCPCRHHRCLIFLLMKNSWIVFGSEVWWLFFALFASTFCWDLLKSISVVCIGFHGSNCYEVCDNGW